jgi:uncharacterized membrane protein YeaQ/YmgE (transglycosylase-associated protein family)
MLAGWIASVMMRTNDSQGAMGDILLGVVGALVGGFAMNLIGETGVTGFNFYSLIVSVIGAVLLIVVGRALRLSR